MTKLLSSTIALALSMGVFGPALAQAQSMPAPAYPAANNVPDANELPDPNMTYKVVFDLSKGAPAPDKVKPGLVGVARFVNTLAKYGVAEKPPAHCSRLSSGCDLERS